MKQYDLVRRIAVGGMGEVYLAHQRTAFGREVAVKIIRSDLVHDITARQRFLREAEVSAYLKHDHILPLLEFGEEQGRLFLVTPYIQGGTLLDRLRTGPFSLVEINQLFTALVEAVAYLHKRGVIHRDLKPSNILLDCAEDNKRVYVRLIDFGIATLQGLPASAPLTLAGHEMGTVAYMAPERLDGIAAPSNDIYSLGIILYQMITGQLPKAGEMASLPRPFSHIVAHCIVTNTQQRFASADDLLSSFAQAYEVVKHAHDVNGPYSAPRHVTAPLANYSVSKDLLSLSSLKSTMIKENNLDELSSSSSPPLQKATLDSMATLPHPEVVLPALPSKIILNDAADVSDAPALSRSEMILPALPGGQKEFSGEDYSATTAVLDPVSLAGSTSAKAQKPVVLSHKRSRHQKMLLIPTIALLLAILLILGTLGYQAFQASILATITLSPRIQSISTIFKVNAKLGIKNINAANSSLPAGVFSSRQTSSQQGTTTGITHCFLEILNCRQAVALSDIESLSSQIQPTLRSKIDQDLQKQAHDANATTVGNPTYSDETIIPNPSAGTASRSVTVTMGEQGSLEYFKAKDVDDIAIALLKQKLPLHYQLIDGLTQIGQPVVEQVNADGSIQIAVAVGGIVRYQLSASELTAMQNRIKGLSQNDAQAQIAKNANIDPKSIGIHISYGDHIPHSVGQIKIETINASGLPTVALTPIAS